ncbi:MAG: 2-oxo acid dehydrogenase subunit E2, partial [Verrucomicrobiota bacterium]
MAFEIKVPNAGESITSAVISTWHKTTGDSVQPGDLLVTIDTDKVSTELQSEAAGILEITAQAGEEVKIGAVIGLIGSGVGGGSAPAPAAVPAAAGKAEPEKREAAPVAAPVAPVAEAPVKPAELVVPKVDLSVVPRPVAEVAAAIVDDAGRTTRKRMTPLRRKIATQRVNAQHTAAILTTFNEVDMTEIMNLRKLLQDSFVARHGVKLGFMSFFIKSVCEALKAVPQVNGRIEGDDIVINHYYDIGVAVGTEKGLVVPV